MQLLENQGKTRRRTRTLCPVCCPGDETLRSRGDVNDNDDAKNSRWRISGVKVVDPRPIENYEALRSRGSYSPGLDPIISCPLSGSACYAIGLRDPDRRAVCFVSLIAERLSGGPPRLHLPLQRSPFASLPCPSSHSDPGAPHVSRFFVPVRRRSARPPFYF